VLFSVQYILPFFPLYLTRHQQVMKEFSLHEILKKKNHTEIKSMSLFDTTITSFSNRFLSVVDTCRYHTPSKLIPTGLDAIYSRLRPDTTSSNLSIHTSLNPPHVTLAGHLERAQIPLVNPPLNLSTRL